MGALNRLASVIRHPLATRKSVTPLGPRAPILSGAMLVRAAYGDTTRGRESDLPFSRYRSLQPAPINWRVMRASWDLYMMSWLPQAAVGKIATEATKEDWQLIPRFSKRCRICDTRYDDPVQSCETVDCPGDLADPDPRQAAKAKTLFERPHPKFSLKTMIRRMIVYQQTLSNWYLHLKFNQGMLVGLEVLPSEWIERYVGTPRAFCPACYEPDETTSGDRVGEPCDKCPKSSYASVAYTRYNVEGKPVARYYEAEIAHGMINIQGDGWMGYPKILPIQHAIRTLSWMEMYQADAYSYAELPNTIVTFPGISQERLNEIFEQIRTKKAMRPSKQTHLVVALDNEGKEPAVSHLMPTLADLEAAEMKKMLREDIAVAWGVALQHLGLSVPGKLGKETEVLETSQNTVEAAQEEIEQEFNLRILPLLGVVDWAFELKSPKKDDLQRKADIRAQNAQTALSLKQAGWDVDLPQDGTDLKIGQFVGPPSPPSMAVPMTRMAKQLDPRNLPPGSAPPGISSAEGEFAEETQEVFARELRREMADLPQGASREEVMARIDRAMTRSEGRLAILAEQFVNELAEDVMGSEGVAFKQADRNAIIALMTGPDRFFSAIKTVPADAAARMREIVTETYREGKPIDLKPMAKELETAASLEMWKLERIARSETTRISNAGRELAWREIADPNERIYRWVTAKDVRVDDLCREVADGGPYTLDELRAIILDKSGGWEWSLHPNDRCTVVRDTTLLREG